MRSSGTGGRREVVLWRQLALLKSGGGGGCSFVHKVVMKFYQVPWNLEIPMEVLVVPEWDLVY